MSFASPVPKPSLGSTTGLPSALILAMSASIIFILASYQLVMEPSSVSDMKASSLLLGAILVAMPKAFSLFLICAWPFVPVL